jgi:hypothetical protein
MTGMPKPTSRISSTISFLRLSYTCRIRSTASSPSFDSAAMPARWTKLLAEMRKFCC